MTREQVKTIFPDATDEQITETLDINSGDIGKAKGKADDLQKSLDAANTKIAELGESIKGFEGSDETIKGLQKQVADHETAEAARKSKEQADAETAALRSAFDTAAKDKKFVNDYTANAVFESCRAELAKEENKGKGISEVFSALTTDKEGIFQSANPAVKIGGVGDVPDLGAPRFDFKFAGVRPNPDKK